MKLFSLECHPFSVLVGAGLSGVALLTLGASSLPARFQRVNLDPPAKAMVRIQEGQTYTVPQGASLVIKALGATPSIPTGVVLKINDVPVFGMDMFSDASALPFPVVAHAGDVVAVEDSPFPDPNQTAVAMGYLANE